MFSKTELKMSAALLPVRHFIMPNHIYFGAHGSPLAGFNDRLFL